MKLGLIVIVVLFFQGSAMAQNSSLSSLNWLLGSWEQKSASMTVQELWNYSEDSTSLIGKGTTFKNGEIISQEEIQISLVKDVLTYSVRVNNHNNNEAILFTATEVTENSITFENPLHDFPQKISYKQIDEKLIEAIVSAVTNLKERSIRFLYSRIENDK